MRQKKPAKKTGGSLSALEAQLKKLQAQCDQLAASNHNLRLLSTILLATGWVDRQQDLVSVIKTVLAEICRAGSWDAARAWLPATPSGQGQPARLSLFATVGKTAAKEQAPPARLWVAGEPQLSFRSGTLVLPIFAPELDPDQPGIAAKPGPASRLQAVIELVSRPPRHMDAAEIAAYKYACPQLASLFSIGNASAAVAARAEDDQLVPSPIFHYVPEQAFQGLGTASPEVCDDSPPRAVWRQLPGTLYQFVVHANGASEFPYVSANAPVIFGLTAEEMQSDARRVFDLVHREDLAHLQALIDHSRRDLSLFRFEGRLVVGGVVRWISAASTPERLSDGSVLWNGVVVDVTDRKMAEERIRLLNEELSRQVSSLGRANQELQEMTIKQDQAYAQVLESSRLKSELVANISHEIRTPLSAVIGMSELLLESGLEPESESVACLVKDSAESLLAIINDILDFSKIEAGKVELESVIFDVGFNIEKIMDLFSRAAAEKGVTLLSYVDPLLPRWLCGDPLRLRQVLINLVSNAVKFTDSGEVVVSAILTGQKHGRMCVTFAVADTGIGISQHSMSKLFQPFMQADGSTTRNYGGTGLGLAISKRLVQLMRSDITCVSEPGQGTSFAFTLEMEAGAGKDFESPETADVIMPGSALLVIANEAVREIVEKYLHFYGVTCSLAGDYGGALAARQVQSDQGQPPEIILTDRAEEVLSWTGNQGLSGLPIVEIKPAAEVRAEDDERLYLPLPFKRERLLKVISQALLPGEARLQSFEPAAEAKSSKPFDANASVLVAEDNPIMQDLARRQLKRLGLSVDVAANGRIAVDLFASKRYDLVLMDCQMPNMDGFEATRAMRKHEAKLGVHTPIIAITAGALREDQEKSFAAGMDEYLIKPVSQKLLRAVLTKWLRGGSDDEVRAVREAVADAAASASSTLPARIDLLKMHYEGQELVEILQSFQEECADLVGCLQSSVRARDSALTDRTAHQLKGLVSMIHAADMEEQCRQLQAAAVTRHWEAAQASFDALANAHEPVKQMIESYLKEGGR